MAKGEKNFKKLIPKEKLAEEEKHSFLGSIPINSHVKVKKMNHQMNIVMNIIYIISNMIEEMIIGYKEKI